MDNSLVTDILSNVFKKDRNTKGPIEDYQEYLKNNGYAENIINGVPQGLNNGIAEISDWINQYNASRIGQNSPIKIPQTQEEIELARKGQFNNPTFTINAFQKGNNSILDNLINGLNDFSIGYNENRNNAFMPSNLTDNKFKVGDNSSPIEYEKGAMGRLGEAFGTSARVLNKPVVKGLVNGLVQGILTGNPLIGYTAGLGTATGSAKSDIYEKALQNQGVNVPNGVLNSYNSNDFNVLMTPKYKEQLNNIALQKLTEQQNYHDMMIKYYNDKLEETKRNNNANNATKKINAKANMIRANKVGQSKSNTKKVQDEPDWNEDLSGYRARKYDDRYSDKLDLLKTSFIKKYGVDPDKYLKD